MLCIPHIISDIAFNPCIQFMYLNKFNYIYWHMIFHLHFFVKNKFYYLMYTVYFNCFQNTLDTSLFVSKRKSVRWIQCSS
jgi:hypothetical protein